MDPGYYRISNHYKYPYGNDKRKEAVEDNFEWNSDDDNVLSIEDMDEGHYAGSTDLLGFHPYKEIVFLDAGSWRAVAYHSNTSKFQDLGNIYPKDYLASAGHAASIGTKLVNSIVEAISVFSLKWHDSVRYRYTIPDIHK
jgi:hypothetical protein